MTRWEKFVLACLLLLLLETGMGITLLCSKLIDIDDALGYIERNTAALNR